MRVIFGKRAKSPIDKREAEAWGQAIATYTERGRDEFNRRLDEVVQGRDRSNPYLAQIEADMRRDADMVPGYFQALYQRRVKRLSRTYRRTQPNMVVMGVAHRVYRRLLPPYTHR